ncbi:CoF synthetase [uncultured Maribacter sp.]|uniref:CoF synthetase n=1 Tax=uncultured Maribacter sp. TaxID=431308 RepID=UPI0026065442|nr:CoF synthetase [uncultured Maribacter sp.]
MRLIIFLLEYLRRIIFWSLDFLKGKPIGKNYKTIERILSKKSKKNDEIRRASLYKLLKHATSTTKFYKTYDNYKNIYDFPIINKNVILNNFIDFKSNIYRLEKLYSASSSGSTGIPFTIFQNKNKKNRNSADVIYFAKEANAYIGNKLVYIKLWDYSNAKSKILKFLQNILVHDVMNNSEGAISKLTAKIMRDKSNKIILCYPSFMAEMCVYLEKHIEEPFIKNIKSIITSSESLDENDRENIERIFKAPVFERYSNQENGILAQQTKDSDGKYKINHASYFIEVLDKESNNHVATGEVGRIVVTDLFNYAMPMIRYDTGDMAIYEEVDGNYPVFSKIYGRKMDMIYDVEGKMVSPFIFYRILGFGKIKQFQFVQTSQRDYLFRLNGKAEDVKEKEAVIFYKNILGQEAIIKFSYVNEIPLLSSGKRKKVKNLYM